jgi:glyoxylase-like metal-dependent hydrolase (beta-lactamase superfamily II)
MVENLVEEVSAGNVIVLRAGSEEEGPNGRCHAPASFSLIKGFPNGGHPRQGNYSLVDCGGYGESGRVRSLLFDQGLNPSDIGQVLVTHNHPDHMANVGMFNQAHIVMPDSSFTIGDVNMYTTRPPQFYEEVGAVDRNGLLIGETELVSTSGHSGWDHSVVWRGPNGTVALVGDLFWSEEDYNFGTQFRELCVDPEGQKRSRDFVKTVLRPDVIVPGHGKAFAPKYLTFL